MYFSSINELFQMAGHGQYVWSCVILSTVLIGLVFIIARKKFNRQYNLNAELGKLPK